MTNPAPQSPRIGKRDYTVGIALGVIHIVALGAFVPAFFSWPAVAVAVGLYFVTGLLGVTLGFHRLLTHRSLVVPTFVERTLAVLGTLALQGPPIEWVAQHRAHHAHTDRDGDPHDANRGMPWAHVEWLFRTNKDRIAPEERARWAPDLTNQPFYRKLDAYNVWLTVALGLVLLALGGVSWVIWGVFVRLVVVYHVTWLVNSASHATGYRSFKTGDRSTNNWWVALLAFGEGWHNNHHAFPFSARHGLRWFEIDPTYYAIKVMMWARLARNVKLPTREMMDRLAIRRVSPSR